jgi:glycosyltransferase involved in cell wall biosynthesis
MTFILIFLRQPDGGCLQLLYGCGIQLIIIFFLTVKRIIVISEGMKDILVERKKVPSEKIEVIPLWANPEIEETNQNCSIKKELGINDNELLFLYSGNMGTLHNLDLIIDGARLSSKPQC